MAAEFQSLRLADSAQILVGYGLEIGVVCEAEDAAVDLDAGKAQHVDPDIVQHAVERLLGPERVAAILEQATVVEHAGALGAPEMGKLGAEHRPGLDDDTEQIGAHLAAVAVLLVASLRKVGHPEIGKQHADIEGHRRIEGELRIDDPRLRVGDHDRAGMQVAMHQRLGVGGEHMLQLLRFDLEVAVGAQFGDDGVELRRGVPVHRRFVIGVGEDEVLGDVAELGIVGKQRQILLARAGLHVEIGAAKERARHEAAEVAGDVRQLPALDQRTAQDDMRRQVLHDDERLGFVEVVDLRHQAGRARLLPGKRMVLEEGALERQRPALADQPHIGQRLLDDRSALVALDDEDQIEIAVADFTDVPASGSAADARRQRLYAAEARLQGFDGQSVKSRS